MEAASKKKLATLTPLTKAKKSLRKPYKYQDDDLYSMPDHICECAEQGMTITETLLELGIVESTWREWKKKHPVFKKAVEKAYMLRKRYYLRILKDNLNNRNFNFLLFESHWKRVFNASENSTVSLGEEFENATNKKRQEIVLKQLGKKKIDPYQAKLVLDSISTAEKVAEIEDLRIRVESLSSTLEKM